MDETDPLAKQKEIRKDGLDSDLAAHINTKMADLALTTAEKQVCLVSCRANVLFSIVDPLTLDLFLLSGDTRGDEREEAR